MKICVIGLGYIGLPTALLISKSHEVVGYDVKREVVEALNEGRLHFSEPGLESLLLDSARNFQVSMNIEKSDVYIIAVPTPLEASTKVADLSRVKEAAEKISRYLTEGALVILESTVPPGTSNRLVLPILEKSGIRAGEFHFAYCPERAIPGRTVYEMIKNDRIVGAFDHSSYKRVKEVYSFVEGEFYHTDPATAEFVKLMENAYRDVNIALANEFAMIAETNSVNIWGAIELANKHPRVNILKPGPGVGGHCIAIDPLFLAENSISSRMISLTREINNSMPNYVMQLLRGILKEVEGTTITLLGVAYKGDVDDTRETPALKLIKLAENEGFTVKIHDPFVKEFEYEILDLENASRNSDCLVVVADHTRFKDMRPEQVSSLMRSRNILDCRNIIDRDQWRDAGFKVKIIGDGIPNSNVEHL